MARYALLLYAMSLIVVAHPVYADSLEPLPLTVSLASDKVDVNTGFRGGDVIVFGVQRVPGDLSITLKGPRRTILVRRKAQIFGLWINTSSWTFPALPQYYAYALPKNADKNLSPVGLETFLPPLGGDADAFRNALLHERQNKNLFPKAPVLIQYLAPDTFRAHFNLPADVPVGIYEVRVSLRTKKGLIAEESQMFSVAQTGFGGQLQAFSRSWGLVYGLICTILAALAGWGISFIGIRR